MEWSSRMDMFLNLINLNIYRCIGKLYEAKISIAYIYSNLVKCLTLSVRYVVICCMIWSLGIMDWIGWIGHRYVILHIRHWIGRNWVFFLNLRAPLFNGTKCYMKKSYFHKPQAWRTMNTFSFLMPLIDLSLELAHTTCFKLRDSFF